MGIEYLYDKLRIGIFIEEVCFTQAWNLDESGQNKKKKSERTNCLAVMAFLVLWNVLAKRFFIILFSIFKKGVLEPTLVGDDKNFQTSYLN